MAVSILGVYEFKIGVALKTNNPTNLELVCIDLMPKLY